VLALGTATFGADIASDEAFAILDAYAAAGGTLLDTAHIYAAWLPNGTGMSERTVGAWMRSRGMRSRMIVATKGCHPLLSDMKRGRMDPIALDRDLGESLERLGDDRVELYWLHRDDPAVPVDEILGALDGQRRAGRIAAFAASNWKPARLAAARAWADRHGVEGFCASQIEWSLATHDPAVVGDPTCLFVGREDFDFHRRSGLALMAYSSQAKGFFDTSRSKRPREYDQPANHARRERAIALAARRGMTANQIALAWLTSQPFPTVAIAGPRTRAQMLDSLGAADLVLSEAELAELSGSQPW
jgi:aryl-alcohol dehydrogenase-like predicted oxidoreductase